MIAGTRAGSIASHTTAQGCVKWSGPPRNGMPESKPYVYGASRPKATGKPAAKPRPERLTIDDYLNIGGPGMTLTQAAAALGMSRTTINNWRRRLRETAGEQT